MDTFINNIAIYGHDAKWIRSGDSPTHTAQAFREKMADIKSVLQQEANGEDVDWSSPTRFKGGSRVFTETVPAAELLENFYCQLSNIHYETETIVEQRNAGRMTEEILNNIIAIRDINQSMEPSPPSHPPRGGNSKPYGRGPA